MSVLSSSKEKGEEKDEKRAGSCVSCDLRPFREISGAKQIIGDIFEKRTLQQIQNERTHFQLIVSGKEKELFALEKTSDRSLRG